MKVIELNTKDLDYVVGEYGVDRIDQHKPLGEGDKFYFDVILNVRTENERTIRVFDFKRAILIVEGGAI